MSGPARHARCRSTRGAKALAVTAPHEPLKSCRAPLPHACPAAPPPAQVACQFAYTTAFGWYATYLFLRTGHLAAPIAAHAICNMFGFPPFGDMSAHKQNAIIGICTLGGLAVFFMQLPRMTRPASFGQTWFE